MRCYTLIYLNNDGCCMVLLANLLLFCPIPEVGIYISRNFSLCLMKNLIHLVMPSNGMTHIHLRLCLNTSTCILHIRNWSLIPRTTCESKMVQMVPCEWLLWIKNDTHSAECVGVIFGKLIHKILDTTILVCIKNDTYLHITCFTTGKENLTFSISYRAVEILKLKMN